MESKAERTRTAIVDAALEAFREEGFEGATMRSIAKRAGVSVGNAYYYFDSKEALIQAFYDRAQVDHAAASVELLATEPSLEARIVGVIDAWVRVFEPYRPFATTFFRNAADPASPLSPFSHESEEARLSAISLWQDVIEGSDAKVPKRLRDDLPEVMWLVFMAIVLFWVHDRTADGRATRQLARRLAPVMARLIGLARLPVLRATVDDLLGLVDDLRVLYADAAIDQVPEVG